MKSVAFYSYKGGVGRSLLTANTARALAMSGRHVVALDLDLEAPGLTYKFGLPEASSGVVDVLASILAGKEGPALSEITAPVTLPSKSASLLVLAAGSAPSMAYWSQVAALHQPAHGSWGGLVEAALELQARVASELTPDYLLIDARTGVSELGGLATTAMADQVVLASNRTLESVRGTSVVYQALQSAPTLESKARRSLEVVVFRSGTLPIVEDDELDTLFDSWVELPGAHQEGELDRTGTDTLWRMVTEGWLA